MINRIKGKFIDMNNVRDDSKFSNQCVLVFNRGTLVLFFINVEQMYYLDCLLSVILKDMKVQIISKNTKVLKRGICVGTLSVSVPKRVG